MNNLLYEDIFEEYLSELKKIWKGDIMNNHSVHKSMNSILFYKKNQITVIYFPSYSFDLNPIENICEKNKKEIMKKENKTFSVMV